MKIAALREGRALVSTALYRPSPRHPTENVEPPNFIQSCWGRDGKLGVLSAAPSGVPCRLVSRQRSNLGAGHRRDRNFDLALLWTGRYITVDNDHEGIMMKNENQRLSQKVAIVTGGSRGIGAAIVERLAKEGASVAFTYASSEDAATMLVERVAAAGGKAMAIRSDAADAKAVQDAVKQTVDVFGRLDILVNNAGVLHWSPFETFSLEDFDKTVAVNVRSVFVASQAAAKHMGDGGRIINIGSCNADRVPSAGGGVYAMSKSALVGLAAGLARDLGPRGITVNNVQPGPTDTDMNPQNGDHAPGLHDIMAIRRHARPEEVAGMVAYLAGPEAGMVTGANLRIDGGFAA